jgi:hypothetical protein
MRLTSKDLARAKKNGGKFIPLEGKLQNQVCKYLKLQYPRVLFRVDFGAGALLTGKQAKQQQYQQKTSGWPDIFICEPKGGFAGLFIELKKEGEVIYKGNGMFKNDHIREQFAVHVALRERGFKCEFAKGFDQAKTLIDRYLSLT